MEMSLETRCPLPLDQCDALKKLGFPEKYKAEEVAEDPPKIDKEAKMTLRLKGDSVAQDDGVAAPKEEKNEILSTLAGSSQELEEGDYSALMSKVIGMLPDAEKRLHPIYEAAEELPFRQAGAVGERASHPLIPDEADEFQRSFIVCLSMQSDAGFLWFAHM